MTNFKITIYYEMIAKKRSNRKEISHCVNKTQVTKTDIGFFKYVCLAISNKEKNDEFKQLICKLSMS